MRSISSVKINYSFLIFLFFALLVPSIILSQNSKTEKKQSRRALAEALKTVFPGSKINHHQAGQLIQSYLVHDGQSLDRFLGHTGKGSEAFRTIHEEIVTDSILVLGLPGEPHHTKKKEHAAPKRMAIKSPDDMDWDFLKCEAIHNRPSSRDTRKEKHVGIVNFVKVTLPEKAAPRHHRGKNDIETPLGWVRSKDHLVFSIEELQNYRFQLKYDNGLKKPGYIQKLPPFKRLELFSPARHDGIRFAPLAIYVAFAEIDDVHPLFYVMEGGNGLGDAKTLYPSSTNFDELILMHGGHRPTPFSRSWNYYLTHTHFVNGFPDFVSIKIYTQEELLRVPVDELGKDNRFHFEIKMALEPNTLEEVASIENFEPPSKQVLEAFLRIQELKDEGIPVISNPKRDKEYTRINAKLTRRASAGKESPKLELKMKNLRKVMEGEH